MLAQYCSEFLVHAADVEVRLLIRFVTPVLSCYLYRFTSANHVVVVVVHVPH